MIALKLGLRNILEHRKKNAIVFVVFLLVNLLIFLLLSFSRGQISNFQKGFSDFFNFKSDIVCVPKGAIHEPWEIAKKMCIPQNESVIEAIRRIPGVGECSNFGPRILLDMWNKQHRYKWISFVGIDRVGISVLTETITIVDGRMIGDKDTNCIILNEQLGRRINVRVGDTVEITGLDFFGQAVSHHTIICGLFDPVFKNPNAASSAFCDLRTYRAIAGFYDDEIPCIKVFKKKGTNIIQLLSNLKEVESSGIEFQEFNHFYKYEDEVYGLAKSIISIVSLIIIIICAYAVASICKLAILETKKETATYYCLGAGKGFLIFVYAFELVCVVGVATSAGLLLGHIVGSVVNAVGITSDDIGMQLVFGGSRFALNSTVEDGILIFIVNIVITSIASLFAVYGVLNVEPSIALIDGKN